MKKTRCAIVGVGHRSHAWISEIVSTYTEHAELVALCDLLVARCHDVNSYFACKASCFDDFDAMLAETKPDLVIVIVPENLHAEFIVKAFHAGCEVATEKPLCTTPKDAARILEAERSSGKKLFMGFNYRHIPLCSKIRELVLAGEIGNPVSVDLTWYLDYRGHGASYFRRWHRLMEKSGGLLITKATHHFDLANWWVGDSPDTVFAQCSLNFFGKGKGKFHGTRCRDCDFKRECEFFFDIKDQERKSLELGYKVNTVRDYDGDNCVFSDDIDIFDTMSVIVRYKGGAVLNYSLNASVPFEGWNLAINGTKGRLESKITDNKPSPGWQQRHRLVGANGTLVNDCRITDWPADYSIHVMPHSGGDFEVRVPNIPDGHGGGDYRIFDALFKGTLEKDDPLGLFASAEAGVHSMTIGAAANLSAKRGQPVHIDDLLNGENDS